MAAGAAAAGPAPAHADRAAAAAEADTDASAAAFSSAAGTKVETEQILPFSGVIRATSARLTWPVNESQRRSPSSNG